jgi:hypothetical protein
VLRLRDSGNPDRCVGLSIQPHLGQTRHGLAKISFHGSSLRDISSSNPDITVEIPRKKASQSKSI